MTKRHTLNRIFAVVLCLGLFVTPLCVNAVSKGDVNSDGKILTADALLALRIASNQCMATNTQKSLADMNGDGSISVEDVRLILYKATDIDPDKMLSELTQITPYKKHKSSNKSKFCVVKEYCAETFPSSSSDDRSSPIYSPLPNGTFDYVKSGPYTDGASGNSFYYLESNRRVYADEVKVFTGYDMPYNNIELQKLVGTDASSTSLYLALDWRVPFAAVVKPQEYEVGYNSRPYNNLDGEFTGSYIDITFYYTASATGSLSFPKSDVIKSCKWITNSDKKTATLRIYFRNAGEFYGYSAYYDENNFLVISVKEPLTSLKGRVIEIDPGHGGNQPGAGSGTGVFEKDITYKLALELKDYLTSAGATVILSRDDSASVPEIEERRINTLKTNPDLLVSLHLDASDSSSVSGSSVYYYKNYSGPLAESIAIYLPKGVKSKAGYSLKNRGAHFYPFCVTRVENCPAVLIECGFITNSSDFAVLKSKSGQDAVAYGIYSGIVDYMRNN